MLKYLGATLLQTQSKLVDFEEAGGIHTDASNSTQWLNGALMNQTLNSLESGDVFVLPNKTFSVMGGIVANNLENVTI